MVTPMIQMLVLFGYQKLGPYHNTCIVTDIKRGETVNTIARLPIGRVPEGFSLVFTELLSSSAVDKIEW
jgi:hypothetical protein